MFKKIVLIVFVATLSVLSPSFALAQTWSRADLTGTGLSVESPVPFRLIQDKPDPFIQDQTAKIVWTLNHNGVFSTITLTKTERGTGRSPRQEADSTAQLFKEVNNSTLSRVTDTNFLGERASLFEEEFVDGQSKLKTFRKMVFFGTASELKVVNVSYPSSNLAAKTIADRIFSSVQKSGVSAQGVSKSPPANWKPFHLNGLRFETPTEFTSSCDARLSQPGFTRTEVCYKWGENLIINIQHRKYVSAAMAPNPTVHANDTVKGLKELDSRSTLNAGREYRVSNFSITGTDSARLDSFTSVGTVGAKTEELFIKRGADFWIVRVNYATRWDFEREAAERIIRSVSLMPDQRSSQPLTKITKTTDELIKEGAELIKKNDIRGAIAKYDQARINDPDNGLIYFHRGVARSRSGDSKGALDDYNTAIMLKASLREAYYNRGTLNYNMKSYMPAISDLTKALEIDPAYVSARYNRGLAHYALKDTDKALADFTEVIAIDPKHANSYVMRSRIYCQKGLPISAIKDQEMAISLGHNIQKGCY